MATDSIPGVKRPTIADVRRILNKDGEVVGLDVRWVMPPRVVTYPTGVRGYVGRVDVTAPGYRGRTMLVDRDSMGIRIA